MPGDTTLHDLCKGYAALLSRSKVCCIRQRLIL